MPVEAIFGDTTSEEYRSVNQSLCKALVEERLALQDAKDKLKKSENEVRSLLKTNSSLAATAQMLGGIVKHNIDNPNLSSVSSEAGSTNRQRVLKNDEVSSCCPTYSYSDETDFVPEQYKRRPACQT